MGWIRRAMAIFCFFGVVSLMGCAGLDSDNHERILMQHPQTMDMKECQIEGPWRNKDAFASVEACAKGYEQKGYIRWGQY